MRRSLKYPADEAADGLAAVAITVCPLSGGVLGAGQGHKARRCGNRTGSADAFMGEAAGGGRMTPWERWNDSARGFWGHRYACVMQSMRCRWHRIPILLVLLLTEVRKRCPAARC